MRQHPTVLRYLRGNSPDAITKALGELPFKVEIKQIIKERKDYVIFFTLIDSNAHVTNEMIKAFADGR